MLACTFFVVFLVILSLEISKEWQKGVPSSTSNDDNSTMYMYFASLDE